MKRPTGAELRSSPKANQNVGTVFNKSTKPKTFPRMDSALGVLLDGAAVKENAEASKNLFRSAKHPPCGFADILSAAARRRSQSALPRACQKSLPLVALSHAQPKTILDRGRKSANN